MSLPLTTEWDYAHDVNKNRLYVTCKITTPNPLQLTTNRPKDVVGTSGDDFVFRCDLTGSARTRACQSVCNGSSQCIAGCDTDARCPTHVFATATTATCVAGCCQQIIR